MIHLQMEKNLIYKYYQHSFIILNIKSERMNLSIRVILNKLIFAFPIHHYNDI